MTSVNVTTTKNTVTVNGETRVVTVKTQGSQGVGINQGVKGVITIPANLTDWTLNDNVITSPKIVDGTIVNGDINASAAIAGTKISPDFGSQNVATTGTLSSGDITISSTAPKLFLTDTNSDSDFRITNANGVFEIRDQTNSASRLFIYSDGRTRVLGNLDVDAGIDVTGDISVSGTVDSRDLAADGTKLDGIETGATADQTAAEIKTLLDSNGIVNSNVDASAAIAGSKIAPSFVNDITITNATPTINLVDTNQNSDFQINVEGGKFTITDTTNNATRLKIQSGGLFHIQSTNTRCNNLIAEGNITVDGTVDGRDVAADGTKLDGIEANAINASNTAITNKLPLAGGTITGNLTVGGNFTVNGTTTTIDTTTLTVEDKNIELGKVSTPTDTTADQGGITLLGATNKTFQWLDATDSWTSSEHIALPDDKKLQLGASQDLQIFHDGNNSIIRDDGTGSLSLQSNGTEIALYNHSNSEYLGRFINNGAVELYHNGNKTAYTFDRGLSINGSDTSNWTALNVFGNSGQDATILLRSNAGAAFADNWRIYAQSSDKAFYIRNFAAAAYETNIKAVGNGSVELYYDNSKKLETTSAGVAVSTTNNSHTLEVGGSVRTTAQIKGYSGNHTVPSFTFSSAASTGMYLLNSNGTIGFSNAGTHTATLDNNGNLLLVGDNAKLQIGASQDLQLYHNGTNNSSFIDNTTGDLTIRGGGGNILIHPVNNETAIYAIANAQVQLRFDNSTKLETTTNGIDVTGQVKADELYLLDNEVVKLGADGDLQIYHSGNNAFITNTTGFTSLKATNGILYLSGNNTHIRSGDDGETQAVFNDNGSVDLYFDNSKKFETISTGGFLTGNLGIGNTSFTPSTSLHINNSGSSTQMRIENGNADFLIQAGNAGDDGLHFYDLDNSAYRMMIANNGNVGIGTITPTEKLDVAGNIKSTGLLLGDNQKLQLGASQDLQIFHDGYNSYVKNAGTGTLILEGSGNVDIKHGGEVMASFIQDGAVELYFDNSKKFETTSNGVNASGTQHIFHSGTSGDCELIIAADSDNNNEGDNPRLIFRQDGNLNLSAIGHNFTGSDASGNKLFIANSVSNGGIEFYTSDTADNYTNGVKRLEIKTNGNIQIPADNVKLQIGASQDLQIYHDGTHSRIDDTGTGDLRLRSDKLQLQNPTGEEYFVGNSNGSVELYFDDSKKLETTSTGASVTGALGVGVTSPLSNNKLHLRLGDASLGSTPTSTASVLLAENSSNSWITVASGASSYGGVLFADSGQPDRGQVRFNHNGDIMQMIANEEKLFQATLNGAAELYYDNSLKLDTRSGGVGISGDLFFVDSTRIYMGDSNDFQLFHDGTNTHIVNSTGNLVYRSDTHHFKDKDNSDTHAKFVHDGAAELYYDNSKKLETTSTGATVTGRLLTDGVSMGDSEELLIGSGNDFKLRHDGTDNHIVSANGDINIQVADSENAIIAKPNGSVELYHDNSKKLETFASGLQVTGRIEIPDGSGYGLRIGDSSDLQIYHDGSHSYIAEAGTGVLKISGSAGVYINKHDNTETMAAFLHDDGVELYFDNSKKLETTSYGVRILDLFKLDNPTTAGRDVTWNHAANELRWEDNTKATFGISSDLQIYHDGSNNLIDCTNSNPLFIQSDTLYLMREDGNEYLAKFTANGGAELYYDNGKKVETTANGITVTGSVTTQDMNMSNLNGSANEVDNTKGSWSIQEGLNDLFIINRVTGKKYKFNLTEIS